MTAIVLIGKANGSEATLGGGYDAFEARIGLDGHAQRATERLEHGLRLVMRIRAAQVVDVQGRLRVIDESLEELVHEVDVELPYAGTHELHVEEQSRAAGQVDHHARERLIQRHVGVTVAPEARLVAERLSHCAAYSDADVL